MAERGFDATMQAALASSSLALALFVYMNWPGGAVRMWSGNGTIPYGGNSYLGAAKFGSVDKIADSVDPSDIGIGLTLNYIDDSLRNELNVHDPVGVDAWVSLGLINVSTMAVTSFYQFFTGYVDRVEIEDSGSTGSISVRLASELSKLQRVIAYMMTDAHQQVLFSGDQGLQFSANKDPISWGRVPTPIVTVPTPSWTPGTPGYVPWWPPG